MIRRTTLLLLTILAVSGTVWAGGICDCNATCEDQCGALRQDCLNGGGSVSQCNAQEELCLAYCDN